MHLESKTVEYFTENNPVRLASDLVLMCSNVARFENL